MYEPVDNFFSLSWFYTRTIVVLHTPYLKYFIKNKKLHHIFFA